MTEQLPAAASPLRSALSLAFANCRGLASQNLGVRLLQGALPLLGLVAMQQLVDAVASGLRANDGSQPSADSAVWFALAFAAAVGLLGAGLQAVAAILGERHARFVADRLAAHLAKQSAALDLEQVETPAVRDLMHRASGEAATRPARTIQDLAALVVAVTGLMVMASATAVAAPWLPFLVGSAAIPLALVRRRTTAVRFAWQTERAEAQRRSGYLFGLLLGRPWAKDLRALNLAAPIADRAFLLRDELSREQLAMSRRSTRDEAFAHALGALAMFGSFAWLAFAALRGELSLGGLLLHAQAVQRTQNGVRDALLAHASLREHSQFLAPLLQFLAMRPAVTRDPALQLPNGPVGLVARDLSYAYPGAAAPALRRVDFGIAAGERVLVTGGNGAGKSTLVRLMTGLAAPSAGELRIGTHAASALSTVARSARIAAFFQDAAGFELTVRDNLTFGDRGDDSHLRERLEQRNLLPLLSGIPLDPEQPLGRSFQGGHELSAGQWRRLLLARTLLRDASLYVLDEPFAFLDAAARQALMQWLDAMRGNATVVIVEHRVPDGLSFDRTIALSHGETPAS